MNKIELLAPAKNYETAIAAIHSGADAIYVGAEYFGARCNASNSLEEIEKIVNYAHKFYVRVHITINTILNNKELLQAQQLIHKLYDIGADAIIVQDMGILQLAIEGKLPPIQIHISTQCDNRTLEKVKFFNEIGVSRVILARELSLEQISQICSGVSCEIETFIHGALCVSYSGQCYFSCANGGRSANRGECAQPCRKKYSLVDCNDNIIFSNKYLLSLKDFNAGKNIEKLISYGVKSFKIEGRLKDINYVKNIVLYYNNLLSNRAARTASGKVFTNFKPNADKTFNRGYTDYFLNGRKNCYNFISPKSMGEKLGKIKNIGKNYFVIDAKLHPQDGLCFVANDKICGFLVNRVENNKIYPNSMDNITSGITLYRNSDAKFEKELKNAKIVRKIGISIIINDGKVFATDEDNNQVSINLPAGKAALNPENTRKNYTKQFNKLGDSDFYIQNFAIEQDILPFLPVSELNNLRRELLQNLINLRFKNYPKITQKPISYADFPQKLLDFRANIFNDKSEEFYRACNCKVCEHALESFTKIPSGIELMRTKHCLRFCAGICTKTSKHGALDLFIKDEKGTKFPLKFDCKHCEMAILSP